MDGEGDHVHLLVNYPPKIPLTKLVNSLKGCVEPPHAPNAPDLATAILERRSVVAELFCCILLAVRPPASFANTSNGRETRNQIHIDANAPRRLSSA